MARSPRPSIHDLHPDDIELFLISDQQLSISLGRATVDNRAGHAADLYVDGTSDRERLENCLAIAHRIRQAALDLIAAINDEQLATFDTKNSAGTSPDLPASARAVYQAPPGVPA